MTPTIKRAGVVGAGTMGAAIAAHLANVGIAALLLDVPGEGEGRARRDSVARGGLDRALKAKPALFYDAGSARLIDVGNTEDDFARLGECDLVIEAIVERLDVKRAFFRRLAEVRAPHAIVASNTSGISINAMADGLPDDFRRHFLVMHFFNPVRYMKLLEIVPGRDTDPAVTRAAADFGTDVLGKGVVIAKDTPNFIANRLGVYGFMDVLNYALEQGFGFDEVDAILGEPMGRASSAVFRTCDLSGLDVLMHVAQGVYDNAPDDEERAIFSPPPLLREMVARGWLGEKSGQGFYKRVKGADGQSEILVLDPATMEYRPRQKFRFASIGAVKDDPDPAARARGIVEDGDRAALFARKVTLDLLAYAARRIPEIADSPADVDEAMRWGYRWELGPFATYDALGAANVAAMLESEGREVPRLVREVLERDGGSFYRREDGRMSVFTPATSRYEPLPPSPSDLTAARLAASGAVVSDNGGARLLDMGDGVGLVEFRTKVNAIDPDIVAMMWEALERAQDGRFRALVVGNDAVDFSVGANLAMLMMAAYSGEWGQVEAMVEGFQDINMTLKYSSIPVVAAPAGKTLGGGCEIVMHSARTRAASETYIGLVETGVGLIPGGGGCKELLLRLHGTMKEHGPFPQVRKAFETISFATVSTSAAEAQKLGYLRKGDSITLDRDRLLHDAKSDALALAEGGYAPPQPPMLQLPGEGGRLVLEQQIDGLLKAGKISAHDALIGRKLAYALTGGAASPLEGLTEQHVLDLEREAFLSLAGTEKTLERIRYTLSTGKPLRN